jgi:hypothetical protein
MSPHSLPPRIPSQAQPHRTLTPSAPPSPRQPSHPPLTMPCTSWNEHAYPCTSMCVCEHCVLDCRCAHCGQCAYNCTCHDDPQNTGLRCSDMACAIGRENLDVQRCKSCDTFKCTPCPCGKPCNAACLCPHCFTSIHACECHRGKLCGEWYCPVGRANCDDCAACSRHRRNCRRAGCERCCNKCACSRCKACQYSCGCIHFHPGSREACTDIGCPLSPDNVWRTRGR